MKKSQIIAVFQNVCLFLLLSVLSVGIARVSAQLPPESEWEEEGVCARVRIQISQDVAITRTAFRATLEIDNAPENVPIENLTVTLEIKNWDQEESDDLFAINDPELTGVSDVDGNGTISPGSSAKAVWIIIPTRDAAPDIPTQYFVGGTLSYIESGTQLNMPLFPASITVKPDPLLVLNYFLPRVVYGDDPFTKDIIEPAEPFPLGLILSNEGKGTARRVRITSAQPEIIENEKSLLIEFKIIGAQVNTELVEPSLTVDLGEIGPAQTSVAQWIMTSSLYGKFLKDEHMATFEHTDELGDARTSLIDSVSLRESVHTVRVDLPEDDGKPDFLVNDIDDDNFFPDMLYNSDGSTTVVNLASDATVSGQVSNSNLEVTLTGNAPNGWVYLRVDDPGEETYRLRRAVRSDGRELRLEDNAWTTHRTIRLKDRDPYRERLLHLFDHVESGSFEYSLTFEGIPEEPEPPVMQFIPDRSMVEGIHFGFIVKSSDPNRTIPLISATPLPPGATFTDGGDGEARFDWATAEGDAGRYEIRFTASDGTLETSQIAIVTIYSPTDDDTDAMPDEWETEHFETLDRDGTGDLDADGISDRDEYLNNTNPAKSTPGDINNDENVDLTDAILALRILSGIPPNTIVNKAGDINGDGRIGTEEAIHILRNIVTSGEDGEQTMADLAGTYTLATFMIDYADGSMVTSHDIGFYLGMMEITSDGHMHKEMTVYGSFGIAEAQIGVVDESNLHFSGCDFDIPLLFALSCESGCDFDMPFLFDNNFLTLNYPQGYCGQDNGKMEFWEKVTP